MEGPRKRHTTYHSIYAKNSSRGYYYIKEGGVLHTYLKLINLQCRYIYTLDKNWLSFCTSQNNTHKRESSQNWCEFSQSEKTGKKINLVSTVVMFCRIPMFLKLNYESNQNGFLNNIYNTVISPFNTSRGFMKSP